MTLPLRSSRADSSRHGMAFKYSWFFIASLVFSLWSLGAVRAELQAVNIELLPDQVPEVVGVNLRAPGMIDLSGITVAISESQPQQYDSTRNATWMEMTVFPLPSSCVSVWSPCSWSEAGVGTNAVKGPTGTEDRLCCDDETIRMGLCGVSDKDHLIFNRDLFKGQHFHLTVPGKSANWKDSISYNGKSPKRLEQSGEYVVMFTNCNTLDGQQLHLTGKLKSISKHGYLPGDLYGLWMFWICLTVAAVILLLYYRILMCVHRESRIAVETWISRIIVLALLEFFLQTLDFYIWNQRGERWDAVQYCLTIAGALKRGASRFCLVYLALGWGAICESVRYFSRCALAIAATTYAVAYAARGIIFEYIFLHYDEAKPKWLTEEHILQLFMAIYNVMRALDFIFAVWVFYALRKTINYLQAHRSRSNSHSSALKLRRYWTLRRLFTACMIIFVLSRLAFFFMMEHKFGRSREKLFFAILSIVETCYFLLLACIAVLWRPNPRATEYAYDPLEVPFLYDTDHELELQENNHHVGISLSSPRLSNSYDSSDSEPSPASSAPSSLGLSQSKYASVPSADEDRDDELPS